MWMSYKKCLQILFTTWSNWGNFPVTTIEPKMYFLLLPATKEQSWTSIKGVQVSKMLLSRTLMNGNLLLIVETNSLMRASNISLRSSG